MATTKPRITVTLTDELMEKIKEEMEKREIEDYSHMLRIIVKAYFREKEEKSSSKED